MAGRKPGFRHSEETRQKIQGVLIVKRLQDHVMAEKELMTASQVNAAKVLLGKIIPDLSAVQMDAMVAQETHEERLRRLSGD